jgi:hypothetical protein
VIESPEKILRSTEVYSDGKDYVLIQFPSHATILASAIIAEIADPFCMMMVDKDEITLVIPHELVKEFGNRIPSNGVNAIRYRLITFDTELAPTLVGFMALVSRVLADAGISIMPLAAFSRDHLLIPTDQFLQAVAALNNFKG